MTPQPRPPFRDRPHAETPLGQLIAGRIDQAEYRRRMAHLERRDAELLDVDPAPARAIRDAETRDEFRSGGVFVWLGIAWIVGFFAIALLVAHLTAAPRSAPDPTAPSPASSVAGLALALTVPAASASDRELLGAPSDGVLNHGAGAP